MKQPLNEEFRRMQKLAGLITESEDMQAPDTGDYMFDYEGGVGTNTDRAKKEIRLPQRTAGKDASEFEAMAKAKGYTKGSYGDEDPDEEPSAILIFNSKLANDQAVANFEDGLNFENDEEY